MRQLRALALLCCCALFFVACGGAARSATKQPAPALAAGVAVGAIDFSDVHTAERQLVRVAYERPSDGQLLTAAWAGLLKEAVAEGIGSPNAKPPQFAGVAANDDPRFDGAFAALTTTRPTTPNQPALNSAAIMAMAASLHDTHTAYLPPEVFALTNQELDGKPTSETGLRLQPQGKGALLVLEVLTNSPASRAGVLPGDLIIAIDGKQVGSYDQRALNTLVESGQDGSWLTLDVRRPGYARARTLTLTRQATPFDLLDTAMLPGEVGYIRLRIFASSPAAIVQVQDALARFESAGARGVVLDLRGDPGGSLQTMVDVLSYFITQSPFAYVQTPAQSRTQAVPRASAITATKLPFVVLVDGGSASSSEALAQAVQDYHAGTVLGVPTCGCLVGAQFYPLDGGKAGIEIGIEHVLSPVTKTDHEHNPLTPDIVVPADPADLRDGRDNQLEAALEKLGVPADEAQIATPVARDAG